MKNKYIIKSIPADQDNTSNEDIAAAKNKNNHTKSDINYGRIRDCNDPRNYQCKNQE